MNELILSFGYANAFNVVQNPLQAVPIVMIGTALESEFNDMRANSGGLSFGTELVFDHLIGRGPLPLPSNSYPKW